MPRSTSSPVEFCRSLPTLIALAIAGVAPAQVLITEVIPGVSTTATNGDTVEIYNSGPDAVNLADWRLTDLDPGAVETNVLVEPTFAPASLGMPLLGSGEYAVVIFTDGSAGGTAQFTSTNYGLRIEAPLATAASSFLDVAIEQLLLTDATGAGVDFLAWHDTASTPSAATETDMTGDLGALTLPDSGYGLAIGGAAWAGPDVPADAAAYAAATIDFTGFTSVTTHGQGAIRRRSVGETFSVGAPDGPTQWEAVARDAVRLGNPSDVVATAGGLRPTRYAEHLTAWLSEAASPNHPDRRIARDADANPPDFIEPAPGDFAAWEGILALAMSGNWHACNAAAASQGYEVVEIFDLPSARTVRLLRERVIPGQPGFRGQGLYLFDDAPGARQRFVLEIPHPRFDSLTLEEGALAIPQLRPRVTLIAGAHRNNHPTVTPCDGTHTDGQPYRISDAAHYTELFFHTTHKFLRANLPGMLALQLHGFCCPGAPPYGSLTDDTIVSTGHNSSPGAGVLASLIHDRIEAQAHSIAGDLTACALYPDETLFNGATTNVQGRISNGVPEGMECTTGSAAASGDFAHLEQDPEVRADPQHIITAIGEALDLLGLQSTVPDWRAYDP